MFKNPWAALLVVAVSVAAVSTAHAQRARLPVPFQTYAFDEWVGRRFVFLPLSFERRTSGYLSFGAGRDSAAAARQYIAIAGHVATVTSIKRDDVSLHLESGESILAHKLTSTVDDIGPADDIDSARAWFKGKTLWMNEDDVKLIDMNDDWAMTPLPSGTAMKVLDVVPGSGNQYPTRFVLKAPNGKVGHVDVHMSATNVSDRKYDYRRFHTIFHEVSPKVRKQWPAAVRKAIAAGRAEPGMSPEQVRAAVGWPDGVYAVDGMPTAQQWTYLSGTVLMIDGGKVVKVGA